jgi:hypothetical protein
VRGGDRERATMLARIRPGDWGTEADQAALLIRIKDVAKSRNDMT